MSGSYNAGGTPGRVVLVDPSTLDDYSAKSTASSPEIVAGTAAAGATASGAPVQTGGVVNTTTPTAATSGQMQPFWMNAYGAPIIAGVLNTGTDGVGNTALMNFPTQTASAAPRLLMIADHRFNGTSWDRDRKPNAVSRIPSSAATTNPTSAKASAGDLCNVTGYNSSATVTYLKFYNKASAPTVGTDTPYVTIALAPTATFSISFDSLYFATGIAYGLTTDAADAGTTAVAAGAILGLNVVYS